MLATVETVSPQRIPLDAVDSVVSRSLRETSCGNCLLGPLCMASACQRAELNQFDELVERRRPLQRGALLFHEGMTFETVFVVRSGALKSTVALPNGLEQVTGFHLPGDLLGMDSIGQALYASTATALETTSVCAIGFEELAGLAQRLPALQRQLFRRIGAEIRGDHRRMQQVAQQPAEQRVAGFLRELAERCKQRRLSETHIRLPMSRSDLGNHLGLALETTCRVFTRLQNSGVLTVDGKELNILDHARLEALADAA